jgi:ribosomal protein L35
MTDHQLQWDEFKALLKEWRRSHREYAPQIVKIQKRFEKLEIEHKKHLIEYHRTKKPRHLSKADAIIESASKEIKTLSKLEFLASLSK